MKRSIATLGACFAVLALSATALAAPALKFEGKVIKFGPGQDNGGKFKGVTQAQADFSHLKGNGGKFNGVIQAQADFSHLKGVSPNPQPPKGGFPPLPGPSHPSHPSNNGHWPPKDHWGKHPGGPGHFDHHPGPHWPKHHPGPHWPKPYPQPNWGPQWAPAPAPAVDVVIYNQTPMQIPVLFQGLSRVVPPHGSIQCELPNPENLAYQGGLGQPPL